MIPLLLFVAGGGYLTFREVRARRFRAALQQGMQKLGELQQRLFGRGGPK